jgi:hypothetical protein
MIKGKKGIKVKGFGGFANSGDDDEEGVGTGTFTGEEDTPNKLATKKVEKADASKTSVNAWAAVGGASDQIRLNQQILAATNPALYGTNRDAALERVRRNVDGYYKLSLQSFIDAGEDLRGAENKALAATARVKQIEMDQFHLMYPEADLGKYIGASAHKENKYFSAAAVSGKKRTTRKKK